MFYTTHFMRFSRNFLKSFISKYFLITLLYLLTACDTGNQQNDPPDSQALQTEKIIVYTYGSLQKPLLSIAKKFQEKHGIHAEIRSFSDGATILNRLNIEGSNTNCDVLMGIDASICNDALQATLFTKHQLTLPYSGMDTPYLMAFDHSAYGFITTKSYLEKMDIDTKNWRKAPKNLYALLEKMPSQSLAIQDPRTSSVGIGLLRWMAQHADYHNDVKQKRFEAITQQLKSKVLTITPNWSSAYGLFMKGEVPIVLSYVTSPIYHQIMDKRDDIVMIPFYGPFIHQIETMAISKYSKNTDAAKKWIMFCRSKEIQAFIAQKNWMLPVNMNAYDLLPNAFMQALDKIEKSMQINIQFIDQNDLIQKWLEAYSRL